MSRANPAPRAAPPAPPGTLDVEFLYLDLTTCTRCQGTHRTHPRGDRAGAVFQCGGSSPPGRTPRRGAGEPAALLRRRGMVGGGRLLHRRRAGDMQCGRGESPVLCPALWLPLN